MIEVAMEGEDEEGEKVGEIWVHGKMSNFTMRKNGA